jgi:CarboxypepD_reg-like domain
MPNKKFNLPQTLMRLELNVAVVLLILLQPQFGSAAFSKTLSVNGKVRNENGALVEVASVVQKETTNGTVPDKNGAITMQAPSNAILEISAVGYGKKDVKVTRSDDFNIEVLSDDKILGEIVTLRVDFVRATKNEVLKQVIEELKFAAANLPDVAVVKDGEISNLAAQHLLAEVYLAAGEYQTVR